MCLNQRLLVALFDKTELHGEEILKKESITYFKIISNEAERRHTESIQNFAKPKVTL
jgi:hypothetical protein